MKLVTRTRVHHLWLQRHGTHTHLTKEQAFQNRKIEALRLATWCCIQKWAQIVGNLYARYCQQTGGPPPHLVKTKVGGKREPFAIWSVNKNANSGAGIYQPLTMKVSWRRPQTDGANGEVFISTRVEMTCAFYFQEDIGHFSPWQRHTRTYCTDRVWWKKQGQSIPSKCHFPP